MNPQDSQIHCRWVAISLTGAQITRSPTCTVIRMSEHRPASGEELNEGPETPPRVAASVIVLRDSDAGPDVLLVHAKPAGRFVGGAWVFPGGAVHGEESPAEAGHRELHEEAALAVDAGPDALVPF